MAGMSDSREPGAQGLSQCPLPDRGIIAIRGDDARVFLQGVISNDVMKAKPDQAIWAAFLTPQGKYLHDFFLLEQEGALLLETEAARLPDLLRRLKLYKLRSKVELADASEDWRVSAIWGEEALATFDLPDRAGAARSLPEGLVMADPRHRGLGLRLWSRAAEPLPGIAAGERADYERWRIALALPDGSRDMEVEKAILLENGFDELGGVDWRKGCYMGQELTARTKYRGLIKKRLLPLEGEDDFLECEGEVMQGERAVGELRSVSGRHALALLRLQALESELPLTVGGRAVTLQRPGWVVLPQAKETAS